MKRLLAVIFSIAIFAGIFSSCASEEKVPEIDQIKAICELSTLKCYYNNVAKGTKEPGKGWIHFGEKERKFWVEYEGVATIGIDMNLVTMELKENEVLITMPPAELTGIEVVTKTLNEDSYVISEDSFWNKNKITVEEQQAAIAAAQVEMEKTVKENTALFTRAELEAQELIENYIQKLGEISGVTYNITWKK